MPYRDFKRCLCGSGEPADQCHGSQISPGWLRNILTYDVRREGPKALVTQTYNAQSFPRREFTAEVYFREVMTPAGELTYPLYLQHEDRVIRPTTIDGCHFHRTAHALYQMVFCNLTPLSDGTICMDMHTAKKARGGISKAKCQLLAAGDPFSSVFAMEANQDRIKLHHFTNSEHRQKIAASSILTGSRWNLQGTQELRDLNYVYLTDLQSIENTFDLSAIGMADEGTVNILATDDRHQRQSFTVYRSNPSARNEKITVWVDPLLIAPPPLILHEPQKEHRDPIPYSWWEVVHSSIFRIPVKLGGAIALERTGEPDVYLVTNSGDYSPPSSVVTAHGSDIVSMLRIYHEACEKQIERSGGPTLADQAKLDPLWVNTWANSLSAHLNSIWPDNPP